MIALLAADALATVCGVTNNADALVAPANSLRACLASSGAGDEIVIAVAGGVHVTVVAELPPLVGATLRGEQRLHIIGSGLSAGERGLVVGDGADVYGVIVRDFPGSGIVVTGDDATVGNAVVLEENYSWGKGGSGIDVTTSALYADIEGNRIGVSQTGAVIGNCLSPGTGACAGIWARGGTADIHSNTVDGTAGDPLLAQGSGVFVSIGSFDSVFDNEIGLAGGNAAFGILLSAIAGSAVADVSIIDNVVIGNGLAGIYLGPRSEAAQVLGNSIGLEPDGTPGGNGGNGITIWTSSRHLVSLNEIGFNVGDGIVLTGALGGVWHADNVVDENWIGTRVDGTDAGNGGWGVWATGEGAGNVVSTNRVGFNDTGGILGAEVGGLVGDNFVGIDPLGGARGNGGPGIEVRSSGAIVRGNEVAYNAGDGILVTEPGTVVVDDALVESNSAHDNAGRGIAVDEGEHVELHSNLAWDNGACGVVVLAAANSGAAPPSIAYRSLRAVTFDVPEHPVLPSTDVLRVEVYWDADGEARELVGEASADFEAPFWTFTDPAGPYLRPDGEYVAIATWVDGTSTSLTPRCADGCSDDSAATCDDGDPCTADTCGATGCVYTAATDGTACVDGDGSTTGDVCGAGVCVGGAVTDPAADHCVEQSHTAGTVPNPCESDGEFCTASTCDPATGCDAKEEQHECTDGNDCTTDWCSEEADRCFRGIRPAGYSCESELRCLEGEVCDGAGACDASAATAVTCPFVTAWRPGSCVEGEGCVYVTNPTDGFCDPLELGQKDYAADGPDCDPAEFFDTKCQTFLDIDNDGIPDDWENRGFVNVDGDNVQDAGEEFLPVGVNGVFYSSLEPDAIIEIDWFEESAHDHSPAAFAQDLEDMWFDHPGDTPGDYRLHLVVSDALPVPDDTRIQVGNRAPSDPDCTYAWRGVDDLREQHLHPALLGIGRYVVLGHSVGSLRGSNSDPADPESPDGDCKGGRPYASHGRAVVGVPSRALLPTEGTTAHEAGHLFGLSHGGGDNTNRKPNHLSVMNYEFQNTGLPPWSGDPLALPAVSSYVVDYSREVLGVAMVGGDVGIDEADIDEITGLQSVEERYWGKIDCPDGLTRKLLPPTGTADYDCDGTAEAGYALDLNQDGRTTQLEGSDEWNLVNFPLACMLDGEFFLGSTEPPVHDGDEHTIAEAKADGLFYPPVAPPVLVEPGCSTTLVPADRNGQIRLAVLWSSDLDPQDVDPSTTWLSGALALGHADVDANADTQLDRLFAFDVGDMALGPASDALELSATDADGRVVLARSAFSWHPLASDIDGDGVRDLCDSCPSSAATVPDLDGCP